MSGFDCTKQFIPVEIIKEEAGKVTIKVIRNPQFPNSGISTIPLSQFIKNIGSYYFENIEDLYKSDKKKVEDEMAIVQKKIMKLEKAYQEFKKSLKNGRSNL